MTVQPFCEFYEKMNFTHLVKTVIAPYVASKDNDLESFRKRLLSCLILSTLVFGTFAYIPSVYFAYCFHLYKIIVLDTLALIFLGVLFFNKTMGYTKKACGLLLIFYCLGLFLLVAAGPMGAGFLWLVMFSVMTGVLLGTRAAFRALGINIISYLLLGIFAYAHNFSWGPSHPSPFILWIIIGTNFICISAVVSISVALLFRKQQAIQSDLENEIQARIQMEKENEDLADKLLHAQKMEAVGTLAGGVAHDFNNILSTILGYAELSLLDLEEEDPLFENLENICQASERAKGIVHQILTFSRQEKAEKLPCNIKTILNESTRLFQVSIPSHIEFSCVVHAHEEIIFANATQIYQVCMNICTNALHAIGSKPGKIQITLEQEHITKESELETILDRGHYFKLIISDTGHGIEKEKMSRIFEPYFTTKSIGKGTGMGLSIAHGIIKDHRGEILVSSSPGNGCQFSIFLPVYESSNPLFPMTIQV